MMFLTIYLYVKNYLDNRKAVKNKEIKYNYFKAYKGEVPEYVAVSRQTLKNQFELPVLFYVTFAFAFSSTSLYFFKRVSTSSSGMSGRRMYMVS